MGWLFLQPLPLVSNKHMISLSDSKKVNIALIGCVHQRYEIAVTMEGIQGTVANVRPLKT